MSPTAQGALANVLFRLLKCVPCCCARHVCSSSLGFVRFPLAGVLRLFDVSSGENHPATCIISVFVLCVVLLLFGGGPASRGGGGVGGRDSTTLGSSEVFKPASSVRKQHVNLSAGNKERPRPDTQSNAREHRTLRLPPILPRKKRRCGFLR